MTEYEKAKQIKIDAMNALKSKQHQPIPQQVMQVEHIVPITLKEKIDNFWFHYKVHIILITVIIITLLVTLWDVIFPNKFDASIYMISERPLKQYCKTISASMKPIVEDYDKNGRQKVYTFATKLPSEPSSILKIQSELNNDLTSGKYYLLLLDQSSYDYLRGTGVQFTNLSFMGKNPNVKYDKFYLNNSKLINMFPSDANFDDMFLCLIDYDFGLSGSLAKDDAGYLQNEYGIQDTQRENKRKTAYSKHEEFIKQIIKIINYICKRY